MSIYVSILKHKIYHHFHRNIKLHCFPQISLLEWFLRNNVRPKTDEMASENWAFVITQIKYILKYNKMENRCFKL